LAHGPVSFPHSPDPSLSACLEGFYTHSGAFPGSLFPGCPQCLQLIARCLPNCFIVGWRTEIPLRRTPVLAEGPSVPRRHPDYIGRHPGQSLEGTARRDASDFAGQSNPGEVKYGPATLGATEPRDGIPAGRDRIRPPSGHAISFRGCFRHAAESIPTAPVSAYLSRGRRTPVWDRGLDSFRPVSEPPSRVPVFEFLYRGKTDPCLRCAPQFLVRKSGYPPALPVSLLPSFLNEGEADPCWRCALAPSRGRSPNIHLPYPCPCLRVFIRGGRQTPV